MHGVLTHICSVSWTNLYNSGSLPVKLPVKKIFENFFISSKEPPSNFRGTMGGHFNLALHFIAKIAKNIKRQKRTQLLTSQFSHQHSQIFADFKSSTSLSYWDVTLGFDPGKRMNSYFRMILKVLSCPEFFYHFETHKNLRTCSCCYHWIEQPKKHTLEIMSFGNIIWVGNKWNRVRNIYCPDLKLREFSSYLISQWYWL